MASLSKPLSDNNMAHYSSQNWIDYVSNLVSPQDAAAMTNHLKSGCES